MRSVKPCPVCKSSQPLCKRYFDKPLIVFEKTSNDGKFVVFFEVDICMRCNNVYVTLWETCRVEDLTKRQESLSQGLLKKKDVLLWN